MKTFSCEREKRGVRNTTSGDKPVAYQQRQLKQWSSVEKAVR
jgi:hypothetical protein